MWKRTNNFRKTELINGIIFCSLCFEKQLKIDRLEKENESLKEKLKYRKKKDKEELKKVKEKRKVFSPPSVEEVQGYISEKGYNVNANNFVDFYESKGWMVGRNKMKAWKAAVRNWATRNKTDKKTERITFDENGIPHVT